MDLRTAILEEHSKEQSTLIANYIGSNKRRFEKLIELFLEDEYRVVQRVAWVISLVAEKYPKLIEPYLSLFAERMQEPELPVAVRRNVVRMLQHVPIPESLEGPVMFACFEFLADPKETVAVRCFSMTVLGNLACKYPEIRQELVSIIEDQLEQGATAGFRARARMVLGSL
ncbi:hypothetical protein [Taibaiella soli]|uniref:HEAT repeat domain-containing protein n=1 Tax=Taibaiella soli TaxID=1649169 RepID=A0A2W2A9X1_9BACT|nr:hypothetical protein [Taibaiella soli]PZF72081.1 hypothetical protein DN068_14175 [Taibaiella soli]